MVKKNFNYRDNRYWGTKTFVFPFGPIQGYINFYGFKKKKKMKLFLIYSQETNLYPAHDGRVTIVASAKIIITFTKNVTFSTPEFHFYERLDVLKIVHFLDWIRLCRNEIPILIISYVQSSKTSNLIYYTQIILHMNRNSVQYF